MKYHKHFIVEPGSRVKLDHLDPEFTDPHENRESAATTSSACSSCNTGFMRNVSAHS
jgi:hypothetical protein